VATGLGTGKSVREKYYDSLQSLKNWPSEADEDYAERVLRARYYRGVRSRAESYVTELRAGDQEDPVYRDAGSFHERLRQNLDSDHDVIYTHEARRICYVSDYTAEAVEYFREEYGSEPIHTPEAIALVCLEHDVIECIEEELGMPIHEWFMKLVTLKNVRSKAK